MKCFVHDLEVKSSNLDWVKLRLHSTLYYSNTWYCSFQTAGVSCPAPFELVGNKYCYLYNVTTAAMPWSLLQETCLTLHPGAHLVAVNSEQEHDIIRSYMTSVTSICQSVWTSGRTDVPGHTTDWYWDLGISREQATYLHWEQGEPNNAAKRGENTIILRKGRNFDFVDIAEDVSFSSYWQRKKFCFLCEIDIAYWSDRRLCFNHMPNMIFKASILLILKPKWLEYETPEQYSTMPRKLCSINIYIRKWVILLLVFMCQSVSNLIQMLLNMFPLFSIYGLV